MSAENRHVIKYQNILGLSSMKPFFSAAKYRQIMLTSHKVLAKSKSWKLACNSSMLWAACSIGRHKNKWGHLYGGQNSLVWFSTQRVGECRRKGWTCLLGRHTALRSPRLEASCAVWDSPEFIQIRWTQKPASGNLPVAHSQKKRHEALKPVMFLLDP